MALRPWTPWLLCLILSVFPAQAAPAAANVEIVASVANVAIVDPAQRGLMSQLFVAAHGPQRSFARDLLPGRADSALVWLPQQFLVPIAYSTTPNTPLPGYPIGAQGQVQATPVTLGLAQGSGIFGAALTPSGNACYLSELASNDIASYTVDLATSQLSPFPGAQVASGSFPAAMTVEPGAVSFTWSAAGTSLPAASSPTRSTSRPRP